MFAPQGDAASRIDSDDNGRHGVDDVEEKALQPGDLFGSGQNRFFEPILVVEQRLFGPDPLFYFILQFGVRAPLRQDVGKSETPAAVQIVTEARSRGEGEEEHVKNTNVGKSVRCNPR